MPQPNRAIQFLGKAMALEPFEEALQRKLLHLYAATSDWQALVRQYKHLEETLKREVHVAPARKTRDLYQRLLEHRSSSHNISYTTTDAAVFGKRTRQRDDSVRAGLARRIGSFSTT